MPHPVVEHLKNLVPLCEIQDDNFVELVRHTVVGTLPVGQVLFEEGDPDDDSYYLLTGEVMLHNTEGKEVILKEGQYVCRYPLDHHNPRHYSATTLTEVKYIKVNNNILDVLLTWNQTTGYVVTEIDEETDQENDWMFNILRSNLFQRIPAANIQAMFMRFEPRAYTKGQTVIRQGDVADDYYVIKSGRCGVYRQGEDGEDELLAEIGIGDGFGEEALLADTTRNATVTMLEDGVVMRLGRQDFDALLKAPVIQSVDYDHAMAMIDKGAIWLDIRVIEEHENHRLPDSLHIPLNLLRLKSSSLGKNHAYIVYCDTGRRSAAAAYLLNQQGFDAYLLENGLNSLTPEVLEHS